MPEKTARHTLDAMIEEYKNGVLITEIERRYQVCASVLYRELKAQGLSTRQKIPLSTIDAMFSDYANGVKIDDIAKKHGVSLSVFWSEAKKRGIEKRNRKWHEMQVGHRSGRLVTISHDATANTWLCQCDCGQQKTFGPKTHYLVRAGKTRSCGCLKREPPKVILTRGPQHDLEGQTFGMLHVLRFAGMGHGAKKAARWLCRCECGIEKVFLAGALRSGKRLSCGAQIHRSNYKGGKMQKEGYILVRQPEHPNAQQNGYVGEHRLVMEQHIGRYLRPEEEVHHKKAKDDNRLENLELWSGSHPSGKRACEVVDWAIEMLELYAPQALLLGLDREEVRKWAEEKYGAHKGKGAVKR